MANPPAVLSEAQALLASGDMTRAVALLRRAAQKDPNSAPIHHLLAHTLFKSGQQDQAGYFYERAIRLAPTTPSFRNNYAAMLIRTGRCEEAAAHLEEAVRIDPAYFAAYPNLITAYIGMRNAGRAVEVGRRAYQRYPDRIEVVGCFASALLVGGYNEELIRVLRETRTRLGPSVENQTLLMLPLNYSHVVPPEEVFAEHVTLGRLIAERHPADPRPHENSPDPERPLRVGYVSQDFRNRSAAHFIEPILANHDRAKYLTYCYSSSIESDEMTERLRSYSSAWAEVGGVGDRELAARIRADTIDIMVDLTGHTGGNRLAALARKPAPVQVTYMGYPNTTGLAAVDYRIIDSITDPAPGADRLATEKLVRLDPCFLCYAPPPHAPEVAPPPAPSAGRVTFGSFNTYTKVSPPTIEVWSRLLKEVPGSRLLLKNMALGDPSVAERARGAFAGHGIGAERLDLRGETKSKAAHMGAYAEVDIGLDPFPYHGTTTTMEAMWMGVPVVVLEGNTHVSRVGVSLMNVLGLPDMVAKTHDDYVRIGAALAADPARLATLRTTLRERVRNSPLCDAPAFTRRFEGVLREMWRGWCEGRGQHTVHSTQHT